MAWSLNWNIGHALEGCRLVQILVESLGRLKLGKQDPILSSSYIELTEVTEYILSVHVCVGREQRHLLVLLIYRSGDSRNYLEGTMGTSGSGT